MADAMLPGASVHDMRATAGHNYRILVWQPEPRPRESLPVLYLLDGHAVASLDVSFRTFGDENHASAVPSAISLALRFALPPK